MCVHMRGPSHVCVAGAAALLDTKMSNDAVPDRAITTSARLLKSGLRDGRKERGGSGAEGIEDE